MFSNGMTATIKVLMFLSFTGLGGLAEKPEQNELEVGREEIKLVSFDNLQRIFNSYPFNFNRSAQVKRGAGAENVETLVDSVFTEARSPKNLRGTFPFRDISTDKHNKTHEHHKTEITEKQEEDGLKGSSVARQGVSGSSVARQGLSGSSVARQGVSGPSVAFDEVAGARPGNYGKKCIDKVESVEETEYDEEVICNHTYDKRCHTTYVTEYESQQEEECEENFRKNCFIEYEQSAFNETVEVCRTPLVKDCQPDGRPDVCRTVYESECWTKQEEHQVLDDVVECETIVDTKCEPHTSGYTTSTKCSKWPREVCTVTKKSIKKYTPVTGCHKEPRELCAAPGCRLVPGYPVCHEKTVTVVQDVPKEECTLEPQRSCKHVTKLVPKLSPAQECVDVPKEVCTRTRVNPRKVSKPVVKKWCYIPSLESGLA